MSVYPDERAFSFDMIRNLCAGELSALQAKVSELLFSLLLFPCTVLAIEGTAMLEGRAGLCSWENSEMQ